MSEDARSDPTDGWRDCDLVWRHLRWLRQVGLRRETVGGEVSGDGVWLTEHLFFNSLCGDELPKFFQCLIFCQSSFRIRFLKLLVKINWHKFGLVFNMKEFDSWRFPFAMIGSF